VSQALTDVGACMLAFSWPPSEFADLSLVELREYAQLAEMRLERHG
jgi:hypothetical protein